jgi:integrase
VEQGKLVGAKPPLRPSHVWSVRTKVQMKGCKRDLALFNLAIDSKLRSCDVVAVRVEDVAPSTIDERILSMLSIRQIVLSPASRAALERWNAALETVQRIERQMAVRAALRSCR